MPLSQQKLISQSRACTETMAVLLFEIMVQGRPADRALAQFLRSNRQYGSRDRRVISETVFAFFRWWGWLTPLLPSQLSQCMANRASVKSPEAILKSASRTEWQKLCMFVHLMEGAPLPPVLDLWIQDLKLRTNRYTLSSKIDANLRQRAERVFLLLAPEAKKPAFVWNALLPNWSWHELPSSCDREKLLDWLQRRPPVWLRCQRGEPASLCNELEDAGLQPQQHPVLKTALQIEPSQTNLRTVAAFREGRIEVQDVASQAVSIIAAPQPGERWWDCCAGAGGKTLHLAQLMANKGSVLATDIRAYKLDDIRKRAKRAGFFNIRYRQWSGEPMPPKRVKFDGVLVDVPCSCSGTWRRNPDARWSTQPDELPELSALQLQLLNNAATGVKPGGILVYATCSIFERENIEVVRKFMQAHDDFELTPVRHPLQRDKTVQTLQIWPWEGNCDAMFAARFRRK